MMMCRGGSGAGNGGGAVEGPLPKLYSTVDEVENELNNAGRHRQTRPPSSSSGGDRPSSGGKASTMTMPPMPHLFLHFDVNETILVGDPAGGDTAEECLNKIIAKSAFVSTSTTTDTDGGDGDGEGAAGANDALEALRRSPSSGKISPGSGSTHDLKPARWWNGVPLQLENGDDDDDDDDDDDEEPPPPPPPLYTGWTWPPGTCPYYRTAYKKRAKVFTDAGQHGRMYRPLYEEMRSKLSAGDDGDGGGKEDDGRFRNFIPAFFHALRHYFPSRSGDGSPSSSSPSNEATTLLPPPSRVTLVLRTFGTDLPRVAECLSEFARGNHPSFPDYRNPDLILEESDLLRGGWMTTTRGGNDDDGGDRHVYELHTSSSSHGDDERVVHHSGDDEVLEHLRSRTVVGIQDCYPFWRDHDYAPWAGKPIWARRTNGRGGGPPLGHRHDHHHILLDDNIHNDPNDGAGGVRVPVVVSASNDEGGGSAASYVSLRGEGALGMHGRHLIRVPTIRPLLEDDWFVREIEEARRRVFEEEEEERGESKPSGMTTAAGSLVLSGRSLSDNDFDRLDIRLPPDLRAIDLSRNRLALIPDRIFSLAGLVRLDVSRNSLKGIPPEIGLLTGLVELNALSNHLRPSRLPLDGLASLRDLRLLDLRYNRKLRENAMDALRGALLPGNPGLEIRCTIGRGESETEKLSACDRDATLLRSQLEPLSTPQLRKRLERSFGVLLGGNDELSYDREHVMTTLLKCYEGQGPREVRRERGTPVAHGRLAALKAELEALRWPNTTRERPKIRAERYMILQKPGSGIPESARTKKETAKLMKYKRLFDLATETLSEVDPAFAERFTALAVTYNFVGSPHIDTLNVGPFYGLSLGDFSGGAIAVECSPLLVAEVDTRGRLGKVDGRFPHWVTPYEGTRYSLIFYVTSGTVEPQTTAIFPPQTSACGQVSDPWIPPPVFVP